MDPKQPCSPRPRFKANPQNHVRHNARSAVNSVALPPPWACCKNGHGIDNGVCGAFAELLRREIRMESWRNASTFRVS